MAQLFVEDAVASYCNLFIPRLPKNAKPGQEAMYGMTLLVTPESATKPWFAELFKAARELAFEKAGVTAEKFQLLIKDGKIKLPFRMDVESSGFPPEYKLYIRTKSKQKPGIVSIYEDPNNPGKPAPITDPAQIYAGMRVKCSVGLYWFDTDGNKGVGVGLRNVQKLGDGPRIDGRQNAEDEFTATEKPRVDLGALGGSPAASTGGAPAAAGTSDDLASLLGV